MLKIYKLQNKVYNENRSHQIMDIYNENISHQIMSNNETIKYKQDG